MMSSANILVMAQCVMVLWIEKFEETRAQYGYAGYENLSRGIVYYTDDLDNSRSRSSTELPVSFEAPNIESLNYWNHNSQKLPERRTFLEDISYFNYGKPNIFPNLNSFFDFMGPLFEKRNLFKPSPPPKSKSSLEPYKFEYPYIFDSQSQNFLPPPKPIRASIVKLESVTRPQSLHLPFDYATTTEYFQPIKPTGKPSLHIDGLGFHSSNIDLRQILLPQEIASLYKNNRTTFLPISNEVKTSMRVIPAVEEEFKDEVPAANTVISTEKIQESISNNENWHQDETPSYSENDSQNITSNSADEQFIITSTLSNHKGDVNVKPTNKNNSIGDLQVKISDNYGKSNSIKIVTDLTLEGLLKNKEQTANIPKYTKSLNMSRLINYELNKLSQGIVLRPRSDDLEKNKTDFEQNNYSPSDRRPEEFSLDLKILRDTNWDGFTTELPVANNVTMQNEVQLNNLTALNTSYTGNNPVNNKEHNNVTVIVETRVTKSISKFSPAHKVKYKQLNYAIKVPKEDNQIPELKTEIPELHEIEKTAVATNPTIIMETYSESQSTTPGSPTAANISTPRYRRRKYQSHLKNSTLYLGKTGKQTSRTYKFPKENRTEAKLESNRFDVGSANITERTKAESEKKKQHESEHSSETRKRSRNRKPKRNSKSKRRPNGKRRQRIETATGTNSTVSQTPEHGSVSEQPL